MRKVYLSRILSLLKVSSQGYHKLKQMLKTIAALVSTAFATPTWEQVNMVPEWDELMVGLGYDYELYQTADQANHFILTMFRITGPLGSDEYDKQNMRPDDARKAVLFMHGSMMDAETWMRS